MIIVPMDYVKRHEKTAMSECFRAMKEMLSLRLQVHASAISDWIVKGCLI